MTDTHQETTPETEKPESAANSTGVAGDITVAEMREWLRNWVGKATGVSPDRIDESAPMVEMGLSSRDAVAMAADIEDLTGVTLTATVAFQHPTIESLATRIVEGEPEPPEAGIEDWSRDPDAGVGVGEFDIAVVGLSTRLPGDINTPGELWEALLEGRDAITDLPKGRWEEFTVDPRIADRVAAARTRGGYLQNIKGFDAEFFTLSKMEADNIDPQQRMALELTWQALEYARIPASSLRGESVGVFIGSSNNDYSYLSVADPTVMHPYAITGNASSIIANRVSYFYDFRGPSMAIDTACSSSLVAVHEGVKALRTGEADVVVAGGVNALITPIVTVGFDEVGGVLAPDGRIKSFSQDADGYSRSEGGGMLVLKRLSDARRDGDTIMAVIAGSAVNHDGRSNGLLAPNPDAQAEVLRKAYKDAGIDPRDVDLIEAHGTGTILGDPIEADGLGRVVGRGRDVTKPALLGSAKSNFGHLESAAGAASLAKAVLALQNNKIPPSINYTGPNPYIDFEATRLKVIDQVADWPRYSGRAVVGVSGFGFGGANAHIVLRELLPIDLVEPSEPQEEAAVGQASDTDAATPESDGEDSGDSVSYRFDEYGEFVGGYSDEPYELPGLTEEAERLKEAARAELAAREPAVPLVPLVISGFLSTRKKAAAAALADWMETDEGRSYSLESIGRSLSRRNHARSRAVVLARDFDEAIKGLRAVAAGKQKPNVYSTDGPVTSGPVWVMAGFGAQHRKMGKELYLRDPIFTEWIDKVDSYVQDERGYSVVELILDDSHEYGIETSNIVIFAIQIALGEVLKAHGAGPTAVIGQSLGEPASAYFSGGLSLQDATRVICSRAHLMGEGEAMLFGDYIRFMALVEYSADELKTVFADFPDLEVCVYAAPSQTVIGGPPAQIDAIVERCESEGKFARKLQTKGAGHTSQMDPLLGEFSAELQGIEPLIPSVGIFSTVHEGTYIRPNGEPVHDVEYWKKGMRHSVYFTHGVRNAVEAGYTTFLELAPNPVALMQVGLTTMASGLPDAQLIATLARKEDEVDSMTKAMAQLYVYGHDLDPRTLFGKAAKPGDYAPIPLTEFKRKEHWLPAHFSADGSSRIPGTHVSLPDGRHVWEWKPREPAGTEAAEVDYAELVRTAATSVIPDAQLAGFEQRAIAGPGSTLVTTLTRHPGGATVQVHARIGESFTLVYDAVVSRSGQGGALPFATAAGTATNGSAVSAIAAPEATGNVVAQDGSAELVPEEIHDNLLSGAGAGADFKKWSEESGEPVIDRLATIVSMAMGYEPEDVPREVPLIELGLDSLMAVRIKNRVEYDFDLPPIQLQAVRDANLLDVERLVIYALENPDAVQDLHAYQQTEEFKEAAPTGGMLSKSDIEKALTGSGEEGPVAEAPAVEAPAVEAPAPAPQDVPEPATEDTAQQEVSELAKAAAAMNQEAIAEALNSDVPPRDAAERVAFATWAIVTGESPGSIFKPLAEIDDATAQKLAERLSQRSDGEIGAEEVKRARTIEELGEVVRSRLEAGKIDGFVRTLAPRQEGSKAVPVFVFHPAGGSTVVYEPLLKRLPEGTPMFGFERVEGSIEERAAQYVPKLLELNPDQPFILVGWSLGAGLAFACAVGLKQAGREVAFIGNIDGVRPGTPILQTKEETRKRWDRYAAFARKTFNVEIPAIPYEQLEELDDEGQVRFVLDAVKASGVQIPGGIIEHQRTSYLDQRALDTSQPVPFEGHMTLYMADRYHDDAITFEPAYATRQPDGGWGEFVSDLEVVPVGGEHIAVIDEPIIAKVGAHMSQALRAINAKSAEQA